MAKSDFQQSIQQGLAAHRSGRYDEALDAYHTALELKPGDAEANSLIGLALVHAGRTAEAGAMLRKAVETEPDEPGFRLNLIEYLERMAAFDEAGDEIQRILSVHPDNARAWEKKGDLAQSRRDLPGSAAAYGRALAIGPSNFPVITKLIRVLVLVGRYEDARHLLERAAALHPTSPVLPDLSCEIMAGQRAWGSLENYARAWTQSAPRDPQSWYRLAQAAYEQGRYRLAMDAYRQMLDRSGRSAERLTGLADICLHALEFEQARDALDEAERLAPDLPEMLAAKGLLLMYQGDFAAAERYCRRCLERDPTCVTVYTQLSRLTHGKLTDQDMDVLGRYVDDQSNPADFRIAAQFATAHAYDARGLVEEAFDAYERANRKQHELARSEGIVYDPEATAARTARLIALFETRSGRSLPPGDRGPVPIFIVGMPRSGTTLVESVLAAHSRVVAGGERPLMRHILEEFLALQAAGTPPGAAKLAEWAAAYISETPVIAPADHLTDKNPLNIEAVGLIAQLFPSAPIIYLRRHPLETGLSIFRQEFSRFWSFAHRLEDIGHYYAQSVRLARHWQALLGERFITLKYEDFASDFERAAPALIAKCHLDWEDACATPADKTPNIPTFSAVQAREHISVRSGKAKQYRQYLESLVEALSRAGIDPETGELTTSA